MLARAREPRLVPLLSGDQVFALAPDPASAKAGQALATPAKWASTGSDAEALWGECRGSGATPYQTRVEIASSGYKCSCPSRKFPCKHVIGLMLIGAANGAPIAAQPDWVSAWLESRKAKQDAKAAIPAKLAKAVDEAASIASAAKRAAAREERVRDGLDEMERWLCDIVRLGLARVQSESPRFWDAKAARLVDAQAPGVARRVRALAGIAVSGAGWETRMLDAFGALFLLREAYARIGELEPARRADVRRYIGWTEKQEDAIARPGAALEDRWTVLGTRSEEDDRVIAHRAWLRGSRTGRDALVLQFAQPGMPLPHVFHTGTSFEAKVAYFAASVEQRVAIVERGDAEFESNVPPAGDVDDAFAAYAASLARDPWFETMPVCLDAARTLRDGERWFVCDRAGRGVRLSPKVADPYVLHALCGGNALRVAGEWNGRTFLPVAAWTADRCVALA